MAKKHQSFDKAVSNAVDELLKDYKSAMKEAVKFASKQTGEDLMAKAKTCLEEYYDEYPEDRYERTETLQYAFLPYSNIKYSGDKVVGSVGIEYSAEMLEAFAPPPEYSKTGKLKHTGYYGSSKYHKNPSNPTMVDPNWIISNYLNGIHPTTDGNITYMPAQYSPSPNTKMAQYIKDYKKTFDENVLIGLLGQIAKKIK